jgi:hypothetical protein
MNKKIRQFEDNLIAFFNESDLDIEIKRLIAQNILNLIEKQADKIILNELSQPITEMGELKDAEST